MDNKFSCIKSVIKIVFAQGNGIFL
uniref:Uncharacterized protein n=1 Tax=Rhizophora mucronata TaxID=61149 RepID=A0A2P2PHG7_RHIMU